MSARTFVIHPVFRQQGAVPARQPEACLEEAVGLAHAIDLNVVDREIVMLAQPRPSTLFGSGKVDELAARVKEGEISLAVVNHHVSPIQQRNLEKAWGCKVIDRTALILEIFGARAATHEGKLQVELAALEYQKSRLVRSWTHLERQRGGFGFLGGPGESQIEIDRRLIRDRIAKLKKQLTQVARTRELHRKTRRDTPYPVIALVGYTNAGKSTLFNRLTGANVLSMDKLFATLDPTMRAITLPGGGKAILSDTVGFVSDLPTELVAAFRATLEEVLEADLLLHVRDMSHPDAEAQKRDVEMVLAGLLRVESLPEHVIEVANKIDKIARPETVEMAEVAEPAPTPALSMVKKRHPDVFFSTIEPAGGGRIGVSALTGEGVEVLMSAVAREMSARFFTHAAFTLRLDDGKAMAWLHAHGKVVARDIEGDYIHVDAYLSKDNIRRFEQMHAAE